MAISNAVQRGPTVYIYDENGNQSGMVVVHGRGSDDGLKGYTSSSVNVLSDGAIYSYDERGMQTKVMPA